MDSSAIGVLFQLLTVLVLVLTNGFFVAAEFSLVTIRRSRVEELVNQGNLRARLVADILKDLDTVISATQLGITMASLALGWIAEPFLARLIEPWLSFLPASVAVAAAHTVAVTIAFITVTYLHIVLGELAPKSLALQRAQSTALAVAAPMVIFVRIFRPFIRLLNGSGTFILRLMGVQGVSGEQVAHSEEELRIILDDSQEEGVLEKEETEFIQRIFDFTDMTARQVKVPRTDMVCIPIDAALDNVLEIVTSHGYTRFPVYDGSLDNIVGIVQVKDVLPDLCGQRDSFDVRTILHKPLIVPEIIHVDDLLSQFRRMKTHMAILADEFGGTAGLVTMQDLLEEIVGDVSEDIEEDEIQIEPQADGSALINGKVLLTDVNMRFDLKLGDPHCVTLGGLVFTLIGRRPRVGDEVPVEGALLRVEELDGLRVALVRLALVNQDASAASPDAGA
jgi:magnesium and cobalt exporter, CNNM family